MYTALFAVRIKRERPRIEAALDQALTELAPPVRQIAAHILHAGGKRLRPLLTIFIARLLGYQGDGVYPLASTLEMLHAATLLHDDVLDNALTRRGKPAAHTQFGVTRAILGGDALLSKAGTVISTYNNHRMLAGLAKTIDQTVTGQILELDRMEHPTLDMNQYVEVIRGKTAWMLRLACEYGALVAAAPEVRLQAAAQFGLNIGMAFQIIDDALDFAPSSQTGKPEGGDIREGKLTPPVHAYMLELPEAARTDFLARFASGSLSEADIAHVIATVRAKGFDVAARAMADTYLTAARDSLNELVAPGPDAPRGLHGEEAHMLEVIIAYVRDRNE